MEHLLLMTFDGSIREASGCRALDGSVVRELQFPAQPRRWSLRSGTSSPERFSFSPGTLSSNSFPRGILLEGADSRHGLG